MKQLTEDERKVYGEMYNQTHHISTLDKIPKIAHFAALVQESHAYPDSYDSTQTQTVKVLEYIVFDTEEAMTYWVLQQANDESFSRKKYQIVKINPVSVKLHTTVEVKA